MSILSRIVRALIPPRLTLPMEELEVIKHAQDNYKRLDRALDETLRSLDADFEEAKKKLNGHGH